MYTQAYTQRPVGFWAYYFQQHILGAHICEVISQIPTDTECSLTRPIHPSPCLPPQLHSLSLGFTTLLSSQFFFLFQFPHLKGSIQYSSFCVYLISLSTLSSVSMSLHKWQGFIFFSMVEYHHIMCFSYFLFHLAIQLFIHLQMGINETIPKTFYFLNFTYIYCMSMGVLPA